MATNRAHLNIVGRIDGNTGIARHTLAFLRTLSSAYSCRFIDTRPEASALDTLPANVDTVEANDASLSDALLSIFADVTSNGHDDVNWQKVPITQRKYIYSVFDSTKIPIQWADIINNHFDAVFVPSKFLIDVYRRSHVTKPVFHLPLALDLQPYLQLPNPLISKTAPFVFGFIGSREARKNIDLLVDSFIAAFGKSDAVTLRIHCAIDFNRNPAYFNGLRNRAGNVVVSHGVLDDDEYQDLISSIDCFVSLSRGEGFSIVPREFLAAGKPVILSDCFAHAEILSELAARDEQLAFGVEADIPTHAFYPHVYGGGPFGVQFDPLRASAMDVLADVYDRRFDLFDASKVEKRRSWAQQFDIDSLKTLYQSVVEPAFARRTTGNELEFGGMSTNDENLLSRINGRTHSSSLTEELRATPVKYVVIGNDGGFFSLFNRYVSYLTWATTENPDSVVLPDWRVEAMQRHWRKSSFTSFCYGTPADGNVWLKLFEALPYPDYPEHSYDDTSLLYRGAELKDDYNEVKEPWLTYMHAYKLYKSPMFQRWRNWYYLHLSTYVRLRPHLVARISEIHDRYLRGFKVISAHIRHPSHGIEQPGSRLPTVDLYCQKIREIMDSQGLHRKETRIFLATDQSSVVEQLTAEFGDMLVTTSNVERTTKDHDASFNQLSPAERMREGFQIQHLTAADPGKWSAKMAEDVLVDAYLLSKGSHFIHITSNIATAVAYMNPRIAMHYCE
jgi:hypothetical protein